MKNNEMSNDMEQYMNKSLSTIALGLALVTSSTWAGTWCTVTHIGFNEEYTKMEQEGEPFQLGTLDATGHTMALIINGETYRYKYLRDVKVDGLLFREFRNESMIFQLGMPNANGVMLYLRIMKDSKGTKRGFAGVCSGK